MFKARRKLENQYYNTLLKVINEIEAIVNKTYNPSDATSVTRMMAALRKYAEKLTPWAKKIAANIIDQVNTSNLNDWMRISSILSRKFAAAYSGRDPVFLKAKALQDAEVNLITSLPLQAAQRAQELSRKYVINGWRHEDLAELILNTTNVAKHRAQCIARTEIAKANTMLIAARSESVGAEKFIWRTAEDEIVRKSHAALNGKVFRFDKPPLVEGEGHHLPGDFPNCRCYPEPILVGINDTGINEQKIAKRAGKR